MAGNERPPVVYVAIASSEDKHNERIATAQEVRSFKVTED